MENSAIKAKSGKTKNIIISVLVVLIIAAFIGIQYKDYFGAQIKNLKNNHFSKGDKVYLSYEGMNMLRSSNIPLYQLVTSSEGEKYIVFANKVIIYDSLLKRKDHFVGLYKHNKTGKFYFSKKYSNYYAIQIDKKLIIDHNGGANLPADFKKVDDEYYVVWNYTSNKVEKRILSN